MILQSHHFGGIFLLPSLPAELSESGFSLRSVPLTSRRLNEILGRIQNWLIRGGHRVTMQWSRGSVVVAQLQMVHQHPWLTRGVIESTDGFYDLDQSRDGIVSIISPNELSIVPESCFHTTRGGMFSQVKAEDHLLEVKVLTFPCNLCLCSVPLPLQECSCLPSRNTRYGER
jgi:hypothetical protein